MRTSGHWRTLLPWMTAYAIAMAFLESAVVIYLRELYYPAEFRFPVAPIKPHIAVTELLRELATMVMLLAPAALVTARRLERFAWFCFCFGVWDIFYYVFLKAVLDWPASVFDWDILFLVPVVWVGPVLAPCLVSLGLIALGCVILHKRHRVPSARLAGWPWSALVVSASIFLYTFVEEPVGHIIRSAGDRQLASLPEPGHMALDGLRDYLPEHYAWGVFAIGAVIGAAAIAALARR